MGDVVIFFKLEIFSLVIRILESCFFFGVVYLKSLI